MTKVQRTPLMQDLRGRMDGSKYRMLFNRVKEIATWKLVNPQEIRGPRPSARNMEDKCMKCGEVVWTHELHIVSWDDGGAWNWNDGGAWKWCTICCVNDELNKLLETRAEDLPLLINKSWKWETVRDLYQEILHSL